MDSVVVKACFEVDEDITMLIGELDSDLAEHYSAEQRHGLSLREIFDSGVRFFVAYLGSEAVGCGGVLVDEDHAEVKRMFVRKVARGKGVADAIMGAIEQECRGCGVTTLQLETGVMQEAAIRFYQRHGFRSCEAFGSYLQMGAEAIRTSVFMEKRV